MADETIMKLRVLTDEEGLEVVSAFEVFKKAHGVTLNAVPKLTQDGRIDVDVRFFKVVEEVPKGEGFQVEENGKGSSDRTEETAGA